MSTEVGRTAERVAAAYLERLGHKVLARNWRTRWCEIDLITSRAGTIYFVEVKYRGSQAQGLGLDYITPRKLSQMRFGAEFWLANNPKVASDHRLAALEVTGPDYVVTAWEEDIS